MSYKVKKSIPYSGWPMLTKSGKTRKEYTRTHRKANAAEKERYGKQKYQALNRWIKKSLPARELAGHVNKKGEVFVSARVPKKFRAQVAYHERTEYRLLNK